jgi:site-specific DNA recombinase
MPSDYRAGFRQQGLVSGFQGFQQFSHDYYMRARVADRAISGESMFERDGLLALMNAAKVRKFNAVFAETLSRLSRDEADTPAIYKRLRFNEIKIIDTNGEVTEVHVGVGAIVNSQFNKNLRISVRRGLKQRVKEGLVPGRIAYGYRRGSKACEREIDEADAAIIRRIFEEYAEGKSTRTVATDLTSENIRTPGQPVWNAGVINAMLANPLYIGKVIWNATSAIKNPDTGKRHFRRSKPEDVITMELPHLRIIQQELWDRTEAIRAERRNAKGCHGPRTLKFSNREYLLKGLLTCGVCGGTMTFGQTNPDGSPRVVCSYGNRSRSICTHNRSYSLKQLEATVLDGIKAKLTNRQALLELTRSYHARWAERQKAARVDRDETEKQINRVTIKIDRIVTAISDSDDPVKGLMEKLKQLEAERVSLTEKLRLIDRESNVVDLHPKTIDQFAISMEDMHKALTSVSDAKQLAPFRAAFRNVFERIVVHPTARKRPYEVTPYARLGAIMGFEMFPKMRSTTQILEEQGLSHIKISKISQS